MRLLRVLKSRKGKPLDLLKLEPAITALCKKSGINLLYLFGSYAKGNPGPLSDIDLAYLSSKNGDVLKLLSIFTKLFEEEAIDLIDLRQAPPTLIHQIIKKGKCLYAKDLATKIAFETRADSEYFDTEPLRQIYFHHLLKRIHHGTYGN